jgi:hypothetical protein
VYESGVWQLGAAVEMERGGWLEREGEGGHGQVVGSKPGLGREGLCGGRGGRGDGEDFIRHNRFSTLFFSSEGFSTLFFSMNFFSIFLFFSMKPNQEKSYLKINFQIHRNSIRTVQLESQCLQNYDGLLQNLA